MVAAGAAAFVVTDAGFVADAAAVFVFAAMLTEDFPVGSSGRHSLSGVQDTVRGFYEFAVTGSWPESIQHSDRRMDTEERRNTMNTTSQSNPKSQLR